MFYFLLNPICQKLLSANSKFIACWCSAAGFKLKGDYSEGVHLFPFRTEKLSPSTLMVLD